RPPAFGAAARACRAAWGARLAADPRTSVAVARLVHRRRCADGDGDVRRPAGAEHHGVGSRRAYAGRLERGGAPFDRTPRTRARRSAPLAARRAPGRTRARGSRWADQSLSVRLRAEL